VKALAMVRTRGRKPLKLWQVAAVAILILGTVGISIGAWTWYQRNKEHNRAEVEANADQIVVTTKKTLDGYANQIASAVALFTQPGLIDRSEFHAYVNYLNLYNRFKGIYGLGLISVVPAASLPAFVAGWRSDGEPGYVVSPPGSRPDYCLVSQLDEKNLKSSIPLIGYDLCTVPKLVTVLGSSTASGTVRALAESSIASGPGFAGNFVLLAPVYSGHPATVAERESQHVGWAAALVDGSQLLDAALGPTESQVNVELFSGSVASKKQLVVTSPGGSQSSPQGSVVEHFTDSGTWTMLIRPLRGAPGPANPLEAPALVFIMAVLLNVALAGLVWDLGRGRLRARRSFMQSEERFRSLASCSPVGILELNQEGIAQYFNPRLNEIAGVDSDYWRDHKWSDCVLPEDQSSVVTSALMAWDNKEDLGVSFRLLRPSGEVRNVRVLAAPVTGGTDVTSSFVATVQDVTEEVAATKALAFQAMHDSLTGLPNRALFVDRLSVELAHAARSGSDLAVMFLDLDGFKVVNDGMGHQAGDELLEAIAARLRGVVRAGETVARLGGDEFTFIFHDVDGTTKAAAVAQRILAAVDQPVQIKGREIVVTASIGIVLPRPGAQADEVLRDADAGMYRAKETGRARFEIFDEDQRRAVVKRLTTEDELRHAIERDQLRLYYQPLVSPRTGRVLGTEASLRWEHPTRGILDPGEFVSVAEETGLIGALGAWALRNAAAECGRWDRDDAGPRIEILAVHVSAGELASPALGLMVDDALRSNGIDAGRLSIMVSESVIASEDNATRRSLDGLRDQGVGLAIADFGTGCSSLASLSTLPVNLVKLDKSFIERLDVVPKGGPIVVAIVEMVHALALRVVADGVVREEQRRFLVECGCDIALGPLWSEPLPAEEFAGWCRAHKMSSPEHDHVALPSGRLPV
jgi:diguanylate cyclase (GGDEF)-like protein/PAS domain S-box-containing protein